MTNFGYCDILDDGRVVYGPWQTPSLVFGSAAPIAISAQALFVRAVIGPDGKGWATWQAHDTGQCWVACEDGRTLALGPTFGVAPVLIYSDGVASVYVLAAQTGSTWAEWSIPTATMGAHVIDSGMMPGTSQGFSDYSAAFLPLLYDPIFRALNGQTVGYLSGVRAGRQVAQAAGALPASMVISDGTTLGTLNRGDCFYPHLSANGQYWCCLGTNTMYHGAVPATIPPLVTDAPVSVPTFAPNPRLAYVFPADVPDAKFSLE